MKRIAFLMILLAVVLAACGGTTATVTVTPSQPSASPTPSVPTATSAPTPTPIPGGCMLVPLMPGPDSTFAPVSSSDWVRGSANASLTLLEYSDFECPYCAQLATLLDKLLAASPNDLRVVFRHFPLSIHDKAPLAAQAAEAAGLQGKFWEMHDLLMSRQAEWSTKTLADFETWIKEQAGTIGLDAAKFATDLKDPAIVKKVSDTVTTGLQAGLDHTPFIVLNGRAFSGSPDEPTLTYLINLFKQVYAMEPRRVKECPPLTIDKTRQYFATLNTSKGDVVLQLYPDKAPLAVNSFVSLAQKGYFDNTPFHRVVQDFVAQTGDPSGTGLGNPGYAFNNEISDLKFDKEGVVGMASAGPNTNGSQFFITYAAQPHLDGSYTIFGQVTQGMDVLKKLTVRDPQDPAAAAPDMILKVTIEQK